MSKTFAILTFILCAASGVGGYVCQSNLGLWRYRYYHNMSDEKLRTKVANDSDSYAMALLGMRMLEDSTAEDGTVVVSASNKGEALRLIAQSAAMGNAWGQNNLGYVYYSGLGVKQNHRIASVMFARSALQGWPQAQSNLSVYYYKIERDTAEAERWFSASGL